LPRPRTSRFLLALLLLGLTGCTKKVSSPAIANQRPVVRLTNAPASATGRYSYSYDFRWVGYDPDGEIDHFVYAIDPSSPSPAQPQPDTAWVSTTANGGTFTFTATDPDSVATGQAPTSSRYHVFAIKAVDNKGLESAPAISAFNAQTLSPTASITSPAPSSRNRQYVPPSLTISWTGNDPDGVASHSPVYYRTKLLTSNTEVPTSVAVQFPDSVLRYYQPRGWAGWDSVGPRVTSHQYLNLVPLAEYAFCVVAFDEAGAYTPYFSMDSNMLYFRAIYAAVGGPLITMFNDFFSYTYQQSVWNPIDPRYEFPLEIPANVPITFNWSAAPYPGAPITGYRWVLDPVDIFDYSARADERTDTSHWSALALGNQQATVGPFSGSAEHHFYIEASDLNGLKSLGHIHFRVIPAAFTRDLLVIEDTRFLLDRATVGAATCINQPLGRWPTAAELDTFLFARGGVPIRCYPAGSVSRPGLLAGYDFDTLGTRLGRVDNAPDLSRLAGYRHVLWLTDGAAANLNNSANDLVSGMTAMRYMNQLGAFNPLSAYIRMGGEVWLAGGGSIAASLLGRGGTSLVPGKFAYDFAHWRSTMKGLTGSLQLNLALGRLSGDPGPYAALPPQLNFKSLAAGDSMPAWRTSSGDFYSNTATFEAITSPDLIREDFDPTLLGQDIQSTLDTLYKGAGATVPPSNAMMTVYHGQDNARVIVSGFDLWNFQKAELRQLVDTIFQGLWGISPRPAAIGAPPAWRPASQRPAPQQPAVALPRAPAAPAGSSVSRR